MPDIPRLQLTHGQVAWALCQGREPDDQALDLLRYLRQLGVPFTEAERGAGRGNRLHYNFDHLVECALAVFAIRHGMKPGLAARFLTGERKALREFAREQYKSVPEAGIDDEWVKSRGRIRPMLAEEQYIRLHNQYAEKGSIEAMTLEEALAHGGTLGDFVERFETRAYPLVPLKRVMLEAVAWAREAPVSPPGRPPRRAFLVAAAKSLREN